MEDQEFAESKAASQNNSQTSAGNRQQPPPPMPTDKDGFMQIPDGIDEELPFN